MFDVHFPSMSNTLLQPWQIKTPQLTHLVLRWAPGIVAVFTRKGAKRVDLTRIYSGFFATLS